MRYDAAMILGKELRRDPARAVRELRARSAGAAVAWRAGVPVIVTLEAPLRGQDEAGSTIVARMLGELGVPPEAIYAERTTRSTREEALGLLRLARARSWSRLLVLTSTYHLDRSRAYFSEVLGEGRVEVRAPEAFLALAQPREAAWITAGVPDSRACAEEARVEWTFSRLARALRPLPAPWRWRLEVVAGGLYRGVRDGWAGGP